MKKRLVKKFVKKLSDKDLYEHVAYSENKRLRGLVEEEFDKRFKETFEQEEKMAEDLMQVSYEVDKLMK